MRDPKIWQMYDVSHNKYIVAGDSYDGHIYNQDANDRANSFWTLEYTGATSTSFYIRDLRHGKTIVAGDNYDGNLYHQDPNGRQNAMWTKVPVPNQTDVFYLQDLKHHKCIVAGDNYDGKLYHQDRNGRLNAMWNFTMDSITGPKFGLSRLPLRDESEHYKTITYCINNQPTNMGMSKDRISELIGVAFDKWTMALRTFDISFSAIQMPDSQVVDLQFEWGSVQQESGAGTTRAAVTASAQAQPLQAWGNTTSAPVKVTYNQDLNWRDLSNVAIPPNPSGLLMPIEFAVKSIVNLVRKDTDFLSVTCHEIGHVLGLEHSTIPDSIIRSTATDWGTYFITRQQSIPNGDVQRVGMRYLDYVTTG
jgi:hypothetical protein